MSTLRPSNLERAFKTFIGVDLGGGKGKNTALARLQKTDEGVRVVYVSTKTPSRMPFFDTDLLHYISEYRQDAVLAIDAPLLPSVCLRCRLEVCQGLGACQDPVVRWFSTKGEQLFPEKRNNHKPPITAYTQRACELILHKRFGIFPRETLGQGMGPLTARAHYLRRALEQDFTLNKNLLEVYPKATLQALFGATLARRYKLDFNTWGTRAQILEALGHNLRFEVWREGCLTNIHCFDAVICAYTAYLWANQGWTLPEEDQSIFEKDGWIWFPPISPDQSDHVE